MAPSGTSSLDPQAVALAKAIRQTESGGNFQAPGKSGEYGAYQYTEPTWAKDSAAAGVNVPLKQATPEQQNQVAYTKIKSMKDAGLNVGQIASAWNAGSNEPNAYTGKFSDGSPSTGINKYGVHYDVPAYAKSVATAYQTLKQGGEVQVDPNNPSSIANQTPVQTPAPAPHQNTLLDNPLTRGVESLFPGKATGEAIGTLGGLALEKLKGAFGEQDNSKFYDTSAPSPLAVGGDIAQGALMVGAGLPEAGATSTLGKAAIGGAKGIPTAATALGRIGTTAALGGGLAATGALAQGNTKIGDIAKQTAVGAAEGGALGVAGEAINKIASVLPQRLVQGAIKNSNPDVANYALTKKMGTPTKMLAESDSALKTIGTDLGSALTHSNVADVVIPSEQIVPKVIEAFPNAELSPEALAQELNKIAPLQKSLITKLFSGEGLSIDELHTLNSAIGQNTYKTVFDDPTTKAGKAIGNAFYQASKQIITSVAPDTTPLFEQYSKEKQLNEALLKLAKRGSKAQALTLKDIMSLMGGFAALGPMGALGTLAAERIATSPTANLKAAGMLNKVVGPAVQGAARGVLPTLLRNVPK